MSLTLLDQLTSDRYDGVSCMLRKLRLISARLPRWITSGNSDFACSHSQSGQVAVIILLLMVVLLTVGLSVASRTTQDLLTSKQTSDSARVFNAAETGVDEALSQLESSYETGQLETSGTLEINNAQVAYQIVSTDTLEARADEGVSLQVDLVNRQTTPNGLPAGGPTLRLEWSDTNMEGDCGIPASLLLTTYSMSGGTVISKTTPVQGCNRSDGFELPNATAAAPYRFRHDLALQAGDLFVRIKPLYGNTQLKVTGSGITLPVQSYTVSAEARNNEGNETKKIEVTRTLPTAPAIMDYALYSGTTLNKVP